MTRSSPKVDVLTSVNLCAISLAHLTLTALEGAYSKWHQSLSTADATFGLAVVIIWGFLIYILHTEWGNLVAQYWPRELFRDRALSWLEILVTGLVGYNVVWILWERPNQTGIGSWDEVLRVVYALLLVIGAIPGVVHMWVALKNRRSKLGRPQSQIS